MVQPLFRAAHALVGKPSSIARAQKLWRVTWAAPPSLPPQPTRTTQGLHFASTSTRKKVKAKARAESTEAEEDQPPVKSKRTRKASPAKTASPPAPSKLSTSAQGTAFEHSTLALLQHAFRPSSSAQPSPDDAGQSSRVRFGMHLDRTGGAGDGGVDLAGWWRLPSSPSSLSSPLLIRIAVQCKSEAKKLGPVHVRELEGTLFRLSSRQTKDSKALIDALESGDENETSEFNNPSTPLVGILTSSAGFSKACALSAMASSFPLMLLHHASSNVQGQGEGEEEAPTTPQTDKLPQALLWNATLERGLLQGRGELRWARRAASPGAEGEQSMWPTFVWDGVEAG